MRHATSNDNSFDVVSIGVPRHIFCTSVIRHCARAAAAAAVADSQDIGI